ncbi:MAG TPA: zf-HC2 domain-containing protein [Bryobacteraceae bacterium]|jgi:anti-sigma factor RsiW|nr:zf-HC2 domain-containing protein [Bryobacteraceae bacterium]
MRDQDCQAIFARLSEYLDQELPAETCEELESHIQNCALCVEFVNSLKKSVGLHRAYRPAADPPALTPAVKQSLREAYQRMLDART